MGKVPTSRAPGPDPQLLEVAAEEQLVGVLPEADLGDLEDCAGHLIWGDYGELQPGQVSYLPIWLAILLAKKHRCKIILPEWMKEENLEGTLAQERESPSDFAPLPFYYYEISQALITEGQDRLLGATAKISPLLREIRKLRMEKLTRGLKDLEAAHTVKLPGVAARELFALRPLFLPSLAVFEHFDKMEEKLVADTQATGEQTPYGTMGTGSSGL